MIVVGENTNNGGETWYVTGLFDMNVGLHKSTEYNSVLHLRQLAVYELKELGAGSGVGTKDTEHA